MSKFTDLAVRYIADLRSDFGLEPFQAAGIVGNGGEESDGFEKVHESDPIGGGAGGLGHFQWTGRSSANNRRLLFEQWLERPEHVAKDWGPDTYDANYSMLYRELRQGGTEHASLVAVKQTSTLEQATEVFMHKFERPNENYLHLDVRINWAKKALAAYVAAGSPVAPPPATTHAQTEVLPPLPKIDPNTLAPIINAALPILLQLLAQRTQGTTGAQPGHGIDLAAILAQLMGGPVPQPVPPVPPPPPVVVTAPPKESNPLSMLFSVILGSVTAGTMASGHLGTPFGMGQDPTLNGSLAAIASIASPFIAMIPGGYGVFINAGLNLLTGIAKLAPKPPTK